MDKLPNQKNNPADLYLRLMTQKLFADFEGIVLRSVVDFISTKTLEDNNGGQMIAEYTSKEFEIGDLTSKLAWNSLHYVLKKIIIRFNYTSAIGPLSEDGMNNQQLGKEIILRLSDSSILKLIQDCKTDIGSILTGTVVKEIDKFIQNPNLSRMELPIITKLDGIAFDQRSFNQSFELADPETQELALVEFATTIKNDPKLSQLFDQLALCFTSQKIKTIDKGSVSGENQNFYSTWEDFETIIYGINRSERDNDTIKAELQRFIQSLDLGTDLRVREICSRIIPEYSRSEGGYKNLFVNWLELMSDQGLAEIASKYRPTLEDEKEFKAFCAKMRQYKK